MADTKNNDAIKTVIALALTGAVLFSQADTDMTVCADGDDACQTVTAEDYQALKVDLADKLSNDTPLTIEEWQVLVAVLDHELEGGRDLGEVTSPEDIKRSLTNLLYE